MRSRKPRLTAVGIFSYCGEKNYYKYKNGLGNAHTAFYPCADHATPYKLALTSPTSSGRSVGIVRLQTKSHGVFSFFIYINEVVHHATLEGVWLQPQNGQLYPVLEISLKLPRSSDIVFYPELLYFVTN
jgi:hypothetical protein